ncbi:MAG: pilus assembly protein PilM [Ignavibacteriaceae bacterium]
MTFLDPFTTGLGIDLSDHHLRVAQVGFFGSVRRLEETVLPEGLVVDEQVKKPEDLKVILKDKLAALGLTNRPYRTTVLVPESRVFSHTVLLPISIKGEERKIRARDAAQREIPIPFSQAQVCTSFGGREGEEIRATVYAVAGQVFDPLHSLFVGGILSLVAMEANTKALLRLLTTFGLSALQTSPSGSLIAIVDVGHAWTTFSLYTRIGSNLFSRTIPHAGREKTSTDKNELTQTTVDTIVETMRETMLFFKQKNQSIGIIVLGGVEAQDDRFKEKLGSVKGEYSTHLISDVVQLRGVSASQLHAFGGAIGAALRSIKPWKNAYQHNFLTII